MDYFTTSDNTKIYYKSSGKGQPIVFIHGFTATHDVFRIQEKVLSRKYKIITYDLRGHGLSNEINLEINLERLALDLKELLDYLNVDKINLVGWSLGGSIVLEYIKQFTTAKLSTICLVDMSPKAINDADWKLGLYQGNYSIEEANKDLKMIHSDWINFSSKFINAMAPHLNESNLKMALSKSRDNSSDAMYSIWKSLIHKDYRSILSIIDKPTLILIGKNSTLYSIETGLYIEKNISSSSYEVFENCTHLLVLENPIKFNRVLDDFISK